MSGVRCILCGGASGGRVVAIVDCCLECYARHPDAAERRTMAVLAWARREARQRVARAQPRDFWGRFMRKDLLGVPRRDAAKSSVKESSRKSAPPPLSAPGELSGVPPNSSGTGFAHLRLVK